MQDSYNLGWKLASVIHGVAPSSLLNTYHEERLPIAKRLIEFDKRICRGMLEIENTFSEDHRRALEEENTSMSGLGVAYEPNMIVSEPVEHQIFSTSDNHPSNLAETMKKLRLGARIPSTLVLSHADSQPYELQRIFQSTGTWNLVVFGGNIGTKEQRHRVEEVAMALSSPKSSFQAIIKRRRLHEGCAVGSLSIYLLHSATHTEIDIGSLPEIFRPSNDETGFEYDKVFVDKESYHAGGGKAYEKLGIPQSGCLVLLRPDQHVAFIGQLDQVGDLERFIETAQINHNAINPRL